MQQNLVLALGLGLIQRHVSQLVQAGKAVAILRKAGNAAGEAGLEALLFCLEAQVGEAPAQQFQPHPAIALVCRRQHHNELLAAQAADDIGLAAMGAQQSASAHSTVSPMMWPKRSLMLLKLSRSIRAKVSGRCSRSARLISRPRVSSR
jgi:hypothetical protein